MGHHEKQPRPFSKDHIAPDSSVLPPELAEFLKDREYACVTQETDKGTVLIMKAPGRDIESCRGRFPISLGHELYAHPSAPVIRTVVRIYDQPDRPLAFETFINVQDPQQAADYERLGQQEELRLLFYDEDLNHRLTKGVHLSEPETIIAIAVQASNLLAGIPNERVDFDRAKADVMRATRL